MAGLYPLSRMQQFDGGGRPLSGARLFLYDGGTSTPRIGYRDSSLTSAHPNPIVADSAGRLPLVYLDDGFYRHRLTTSSGTLVFDDDGIPVLSSTSGGSGTSVDPNALFKTRDVKIRFDGSPIDGYVRLNGRSIGSASSGATERANADCQSLYEELWGFENITVTGGKGVSAADDWSANKTLVLPDCKGRGLFGMDGMGGSATSRLTGILTDPAEPGSVGGDPTVTLTKANMPPYNLTSGSISVSASGTTGPESASHTHAYSGTTGTNSVDHVHQEQSIAVAYAVAAGTGLGFSVSGFTNPNTGINSADHAHAFSGATGGQSTNHTHNVTVTGAATSISIASGGSGTAVNKLPPLMTFMIYIRL